MWLSRKALTGALSRLPGEGEKLTAPPPIECRQAFERILLVVFPDARLAHRIRQHLDARVVRRPVHRVWRAVLAAVGVAIVGPAAVAEVLEHGREFFLRLG